MSTFSVWLQAYTKDPTPKRVIWVCGPERVLVDDVVTTGATLSACARALHQAGCSSEHGLAYARTPVR